MTADPSLDLVLRGGRVIDPASGVDGVCDVGIDHGHISAVGDLASQGATRELDCAGRIVCPGLIDLHTHSYHGGTSCGIAPDAVARRGAVTTMVDAGSAGPGNFAGFRDHVIAAASVRVLAFLNVSFAGIFALSPTVMVGECEDARLLDVRPARPVLEANRDLIVGVKVRVGRVAGGRSRTAPLRTAVELAREFDLPVMVHLDLPPPSLEDVLVLLGPGDILTHCMRPAPNAPIANGAVRDELLRARERGVLLDVGHGYGSFSFASAQAMLAHGVAPDTISSDVHVLSVDGPAHDLLTTMSKFLDLDMALTEVIAATTSRAAAALRRPHLGTLAVGAGADVSVLELEEGTFGLRDSEAVEREASLRLRSAGRVIGGQLVDAPAIALMRS